MKVIKIGMPGCVSCIFMGKILDEIENIEVISYDYYDDNEAISIYEVGRIMPVLIFMEDDVEVARLSGEHSKKEVLDIINGAK